jgi:hypothetical protein
MAQELYQDIRTRNSTDMLKQAILDNLNSLPEWSYVVSTIEYASEILPASSAAI